MVLAYRPTLRRPVLVAAFRGWNDAGEAASHAAAFLVERWKGERFAHIDPEEFFDFQVTRPTVRLVDGVTRTIEWPANEFHHARADGRDVVLFLGIEPNIRWRTFATAIVDLARDLEAERLVTLGAFLADVVHSRPVPVVGSASDPEEAKRLGLATSRYEGPTGIVGVLHDIAKGAGLPSVSFWAAVPHYVPSGPNPKAALALVERLASFLGLPVDPGPLGPAALEWERRVSDLVAENEGLADYIGQLERAEREELTSEDLPSGEALAAELERFLRDQETGQGDR